MVIIVAAVSAAGILKIVLMVLGAIIALGVVVIIHELGHFIAARKAGVKVEAFSVGFGPRICGIKKGETDYRLSLIFFGGYVKMKGMEPEGDKQPHEIEGGFFAATPGWRAFIAFAAPAMNVLLALAVFTVLWFTGTKVSQGVLTTTIGYVEEGSPTRKAGLLPGDTILKVNDRPVSEWKDVMEVVAFGRRAPVVLTIERSGTILNKRIFVEWDREVGYRHLLVFPRMDLVVEDVEPGWPAEKIGMKKGDRLLSLAGERLFHIDQFREILRKNIGKEVALVVSREGKGARDVTFSFTVPVPGIGVTFVKEDSVAGKVGFRDGDLIVAAAGQTPSTIGALQEILDLSAGKEITLKIERGKHPVAGNKPEERPPYSLLGAHLEQGFPVLGFVPGVVYGVKKETPLFATYSAVRNVLLTLKGLMTRTVSTKGISGPVGIVGIMAKSISISFTTFLYFIGFLSANFAVLNLLPIPILDGGHIMFSAIEKARGKPIRHKTMTAIINAFFFLILAFFLFVTRNDVVRFFKGRAREPEREKTVEIHLKVPPQGISLSTRTSEKRAPET
jgi:regulator of sigma E protease